MWAAVFTSVLPARRSPQISALIKRRSRVIWGLRSHEHNWFGHNSNNVCTCVMWSGPSRTTSLSHTLVLCVKGQLGGPLLTRLSKLKLLRSVRGAKLSIKHRSSSTVWSLLKYSRASRVWTFWTWAPLPSPPLRCMKHLVCDVKWLSVIEKSSRSYQVTPLTQNL